MQDQAQPALDRAARSIRWPKSFPARAWSPQRRDPRSPRSARRKRHRETAFRDGNRLLASVLMAKFYRADPLLSSCHPGAGRGPCFNRPCTGIMDTGLRRYDSGGHGYDHMNRSIRTLVTPRAGAVRALRGPRRARNVRRSRRCRFG